MFSLYSLSLHSSSSLCFFNSSPRSFSRVSRTIRACSGSGVASDSDESQEVLSGRRRSNYAGVRLFETVDIKSGKLRLDSWISSRISGVSRARVQSSIRTGLVSVNGRVIDKVSHTVRDGDEVKCTISELIPLKAEPEDIPLDIVYEDDHVLVVNKPAHMVVHPAPGNTPVDCLLLQRMSIHAHLSEQFKQHTIQRVYISLTCGLPSPISGRVDIPIGRNLNNRIRMTAVSGASKCRQARRAASRYKVIEILAGGGSALVEWRLETGRTHQICAHAKYLGISLLGDEVYGGTKSMAVSMLRPRTPPNFHGQLMQLVSRLERPCLHALALGFRHPQTGENINFSCLPPADFAEILRQLRKISTEKVN